MSSNPKSSTQSNPPSRQNRQIAPKTSADRRLENHSIVSINSSKDVETKLKPVEVELTCHRYLALLTLSISTISRSQIASKPNSGLLGANPAAYSITNHPPHQKHGTTYR
jgi:hypothetical protein